MWSRRERAEAIAAIDVWYLSAAARAGMVYDALDPHDRIAFHARARSVLDSRRLDIVVGGLRAARQRRARYAAEAGRSAEHARGQGGAELAARFERQRREHLAEAAWRGELLARVAAEGLPPDVAAYVPRDLRDIDEQLAWAAAHPRLSYELQADFDRDAFEAACEAMRVASPQRLLVDADALAAIAAVVERNVGVADTLLPAPVVAVGGGRAEEPR